jgi:hypothetical protein
VDRVRLVETSEWSGAHGAPAWIRAVEAGEVLFFSRLPFTLSGQELQLLHPRLLAPGARNISLDAAGRLKGAAGSAATQSQVAALVGRFASQARTLCRGLFPAYDAHLSLAPTSLRPTEVSTRVQSVRADDRRLHVDAFPSRPLRGERILRVFSNVNPHGQPRVWRIGEPLEHVAARFLPRARPYSPAGARLLRAMKITRSLRSEYDHLMLQLHDGMKADEEYQRAAPQQSMAFPPGSTWVCFSDQTVHAVLSGQYLLEQTFHLPAACQYDPQASPLAILTRLAGRPLHGAPLLPFAA